MRLGKKFKEGENPPRGTWTISYWKTGKCSILDDIDQAYEYTYELLDFKPPPKPLEPEVGKWYLVMAKNHTYRLLRKCRMSCLCPRDKVLEDLDGVERGFSDDYEFLEEWAPVKK